MVIFNKEEANLELEQDSLNESYQIYPDNTYRRQTKYIIISCLRSVVQKALNMRPVYLGGGTGNLTFEAVSRQIIRSPRGRRMQLPYHFYTEWLGKDYGTFVGCPITNSSWYLNDLVNLKALDVKYKDSYLITLQEDYSLENMDRRLWRMLAHSVLTPLLREMQTDNRHVVFLEKLVHRDIVDSSDFPYDIREPIYLDPVQLEIQLKYYGKR
jgi:hypothetical protein